MDHIGALDYPAEEAPFNNFMDSLDILGAGNDLLSAAETPNIGSATSDTILIEAQVKNIYRQVTQCINDLLKQSPRTLQNYNRPSDLLIARHHLLCFLQQLGKLEPGFGLDEGDQLDTHKLLQSHLARVAPIEERASTNVNGQLNPQMAPTTNGYGIAPMMSMVHETQEGLKRAHQAMAGHQQQQYQQPNGVMRAQPPAKRPKMTHSTPQPNQFMQVFKVNKDAPMSQPLVDTSTRIEHPGRVPSNLSNMADASRMVYQFPLANNGRKRAQNDNMQKRRSCIGTSSPHPNTTLKDYEFFRVLGTGTFGKAQLCKHKQTHQYYCMKILLKKTIYHFKQIEHVQNEKSILSTIAHPGVVRLFSTYNDQDSVYMLLEYVPGGEMFMYIRQYGRLQESWVRHYVAELVLILEYMHSKDIIYRDLKPENILLDVGGHIKLTDFGFAKIVTDRTWTMCGTPDYIAPEIIEGKGHNKAVDWWSLGILIFEMLAGYPPFTEEQTMLKFEKIKQAETLVIPAYFSAEVTDLIRQLLKTDPSRRLGSGKGGAGDIKKHPFLRNVNWLQVGRRDRKGPITPKITNFRDTSNFQNFENAEPGCPVAEDMELPDSVKEIFAQF
mmetsp:Transcript_7773/g.8564  ORF Transcript_7773/g.8564 Transcript_7773/m.8564 type:complete len:610 (+) Transcript_7773:194-2023(+)